MSRHLSDDQFARCIVGQATIAELQHSQECPECGAELNLFGGTVSVFRSVVRDRIDLRLSQQPSAPLMKPTGASIPRQRWALIAAAAVVLVALPFIRTGSKPQEFAVPISAPPDAEEVMNRVSLHLSRTVPSPMEPLLLGLSKRNP